MTRSRHNSSGRTYVPNGGSYDIGALEQRVYGIEKGQTTLAERIDSLSANLDARIDRLTQAMERRTQPQWQAIGIFVTLTIALSGGVFTLLSASQARLERDISMVNANLLREVAEINAEIVPRAELEDRRQISNTRTERIEADILRLTESTYPREVHLERWAAFTAELTHLREEQDRQRVAFNDLYPASNVLNNVLDRIERLESRWIDRSATAGPAGPQGVQGLPGLPGAP